MESQELNATSSKEMSNNTDEHASPIFKVPLPSQKSQKVDKNNTIGVAHADKTTDISAEKTLLANNVEKKITEKRSLISFKPKSMALPAEVYKPHRPSASEYLHRHLKSKAAKSASTELEQKADTSKDAIVCESEGKDLPNSKVLEEEKEPVKQRTPKQTKNKPTPPSKCDYEKPNWSSVCDTQEKEYFLEVLKTGAIIDKINLMNKEYILFGRLTDCDVTLEHPSISRHHALLQFGSPTEEDQNVEFQKDGSAGFYLYELGSTHGTFLNKARVPQGKYYRLKVGHMIKFGNSTRMYILQGPDDDQETEAAETATELRDKMRKERSKKDLEKLMMGDDSDSDVEEEATSSYRKNTSEDTGVTWGMLEDAVMEEEEDEEKEEKLPDGVLFQEKKDPFYVKDPNKALKNFFEKEGMEINFECTEKRPGQWNAKLELPLDTPTGHAIYAEASVTGKRRDAVNNCALEACRILDKHGMFKQSERHQRKVKQWEKDDYYDSDEDQFLDRTGELEVKRRQRKLRIDGKKALLSEKAETYETLTKKIKELDMEVAEIERQLNKDKEAIRTKEGVADPLEEFMKQVKSGSALDSITRSKMKRRLLEARKESARLAKLAEIARPASLPPVMNMAHKTRSFIGKMKGKKKASFMTLSKPLPAFTPTNANNNEAEVEEEDEEVRPSDSSELGEDPGVKSEPPPRKPQEPVVLYVQPSSPSQEAPAKTAESSFVKKSDSEPTGPPALNDRASNDKRTPGTKGAEPTSNQLPESTNQLPESSTGNKRSLGPTLPEEIRVKLLETTNENDVAREENEESSQEKQPKRRKRNRKRDHAAKETTPTQTPSNDPDYCDWMPPQGQTGDGTTALNAKYGY